MLNLRFTLDTCESIIEFVSFFFGWLLFYTYTILNINYSFILYIYMHIHIYEHVLLHLFVWHFEKLLFCNHGFFLYAFINGWKIRHYLGTKISDNFSLVMASIEFAHFFVSHLLDELNFA